MNRRKFISGLLALPAMPLLLQSCDWDSEELNFPIYLHSDREKGHLIFKKNNLKSQSNVKVETLIVGGGIAGLSAANQLPHNDFLLCELSDRLGGTSAAANHDGLQLAQGAHYDLEYPENYGEAVLNLLKKIDVIEHLPWKSSWGFKDKQYVIPHEIKNQCYDHGQIRGDVLKEGVIKNQFHKLLATYDNEMVMPTRFIKEKYHFLNNTSFVEFLNKEITINAEFVRGLDYHMLDDWGGLSNQVSALAGIHYFQCRPYYKEVNQLFSPPQGNDYFVNKLAEKIADENIKLNATVRGLKKENDVWVAEIVDLAHDTLITVKAKNIIYAGQKHALKYINPSYYPLFERNQYAPWLVMNFVLNRPFDDFGFWQNEMILDDQTFLGFINSSAQHNKLQDKQVLTAYYCLPTSSRNDLINLESNKKAIVNKTIAYLNDYFKTNVNDRVEAVYLNAMGHAMPIPGKGYLFQDKNQITSKDNFVFAGVDHHRLPLLFEAIDSGIAAVEALYS